MIHNVISSYYFFLLDLTRIGEIQTSITPHKVFEILVSKHIINSMYCTVVNSSGSYLQRCKLSFSSDMTWIPEGPLPVGSLWGNSNDYLWSTNLSCSDAWILNSLNYQWPEGNRPEFKWCALFSERMNDRHASCTVPGTIVNDCMWITFAMRVLALGELCQHGNTTCNTALNLYWMYLKIGTCKAKVNWGLTSTGPTRLCSACWKGKRDSLFCL